MSVIVIFVAYSMIVLASNVNNDVSCSTQLIDGDGEFSVTGIDKFLKCVKLAECGLSYAIVSIMGPQSSGKNFLEMEKEYEEMALGYKVRILSVKEIRRLVAY